MGYETLNRSVNGAHQSIRDRKAAGILVAGFGISTRTNTSDDAQTAHVMKAGKPVVVTSSGASVVR